jgi:hypothetical protein
MTVPPAAGQPGRQKAVRGVDAWRPARKFPEHYPGECPEEDYLLWNRRVHLLDRNTSGELLLRGEGSPDLDSLLGGLGLPGLADRVPVLAYGANRNPATLHLKLLDYGYRPPNGEDRCIPVLRSELHGADVAAAGLHGHGYLYGELLLNSEYTRGSVLRSRVCLLDEDQLRVLNESEEIRQGRYHLAWIPGVRLLGSGRPTPALGYVADARTWVSPVFQAPIGFASVQASGRAYPSMTATEGLAHALDALGIRREVSALSGLADDEHLASELAKYLNGQWWYHFHTAQPPVPGYRGILDLFRSRIADSSLPVRAYDHLAGQGLVVPAEEAYSHARLLRRVRAEGGVPLP